MASHHHLRQVLYTVNLAAMAYPEAYIPAVATLFDEDGTLKNEEAREFLTTFMQSFDAWSHGWSLDCRDDRGEKGAAIRYSDDYTRRRALPSIPSNGALERPPLVSG
jgi:hypothetical protein